MTKKFLISLSIVVVLTAGVYLLFASDEQMAVSSFEDCVEAGYPVMESHPRQCNTPDGQHFVEEIEDIGNGDSRTSGGCIITGCSSQVCSDEEVATECSYKPEYACYQDATCERQEDGECGWTVTDELSECLNTASM